jgi:hypothetical protein
MKNPLIRGNSKMGLQVALFNLPPVKTCTPTHWCLHGRGGRPACYALRNNYVLPNVVRSAEERLAFSQTEGFVEAMIAAIQVAHVRFFRFHSSGDFYSADYVRRVMAIAAACPETLFRTTTRRRRFGAALRKLNELPNFIVRESLDEEKPTPMMGLPFAALVHLPVVQETTNVIHCPNDCVACGHQCWKDPSSMAFAEH